MKTGNLFVLLAVLMMLGCGQPNRHPMDMTALIQNAKTASDHEALAQHYEEAAKEMQAKADDHQKWLAQYQPHSYGKQAQTMKSHCEILINTYKQAAKANLDMAADHRKMAAEAAQ